MSRCSLPVQIVGALFLWFVALPVIVTWVLYDHFFAKRVCRS